MISQVRPLYVGNALQVTIVPPAGAKQWRVLRKGQSTFIDENDAGAVVVYDGSQETCLTDAAPGLLNEVPYYFRAFYWDGASWAASAIESGTPQATYQDASTDALMLVRDRIEAGMKVEVDRNFIKLPTDRKYMEVFTAPPAESQVELPIITVHLESEQPAVRGIGEILAVDAFDELSSTWMENEGWLADVHVEVIGWSLNPNERIQLRQALRRVIVANLPIFASAGLVEVAFTQRDVDLVSGEFAAPVYQCVCDFTCQAPIVVSSGPIAPVTDVEVSVSGEFAHN